jgi:prevent-host-death family protein
MVMTMVKQRVMKASEFKAKCLQIMDEVAESGEPVVITKNGKPVSKLMPVDERPKTLFGALKGTGRILGDIISPIDVVWEAEGVTPRHARAGVADVRKSVTGRRGKSGNRKRTR